MTTSFEETPHAPLGYAGFWRRVAAFAIDLVIMWIPASLFGWAFRPPTFSFVFEFLDFVQLTAVWGLYHGLLESSVRQATVGKMVLRLRVTDLSGNRITFLRALARFLAGVPAAAPLGLGIFMIAWSRKQQGLHDMIARCLVVRCPVQVASRPTA